MRTVRIVSWSAVTLAMLSGLVVSRIRLHQNVLPPCRQQHQSVATDKLPRSHHRDCNATLAIYDAALALSRSVEGCCGEEGRQECEGGRQARGLQSTHEMPGDMAQLFRVAHKSAVSSCSHLCCVFSHPLMLLFVCPCLS